MAAPIFVCSQIKAVGSTNKIMAGGCSPFCLWNSEMTVDDIEFAIELDDFPAWVDDIKKIFAKDLREDGKAPDRYSLPVCSAGAQFDMIWGKTATLFDCQIMLLLK